VRPTRIRDLVAAGVAAGVAAYLLVRAFYGELPPLPVTFAITTFLLSMTELFLAQAIRARLGGRPRTKAIMPIAVARAAALAKASSLLGGLATGAWLGTLLQLAERWELRQAREDAVVAGLSVATAVLLVVAALRLEKACRVPDVPELSTP